MQNLKPHIGYYPQNFHFVLICGMFVRPSVWNCFSEIVWTYDTSTVGAFSATRDPCPLRPTDWLQLRHSPLIDLVFSWQGQFQHDPSDETTVPFSGVTTINMYEKWVMASVHSPPVCWLAVRKGSGSIPEWALESYPAKQLKNKMDGYL